MKKFIGLINVVTWASAISFLQSIAAYSAPSPSFLIAQAQPSCTFGAPSGGAIVEKAGHSGLSTSSGTSGSILLNCTSNATLNIYAPVGTSTTAQTYLTQPGVTCQVLVQNAPGKPSIGNNSCSNSRSDTIDAGSANLQLDLDVSGALVPAGSYGFQIQLIAVPQ